ncbi:hypothetical protein SALBM217S_00555 [Streptomyces griseoloalbus]
MRGTPVGRRWLWETPFYEARSAANTSRKVSQNALRSSGLRLVTSLFDPWRRL